MQLARAHQHRAQRMLCNELGRGALPVPASARTRRTCMIWTCNGRPNVSAQAASTRVSVPPSIGTTPPGTPTVLTVLHNVTTRGQSPVWDSRTQTLYFTDVEDPKVIVHGANGGEISMPEPVGAVFLTTQPNIVLAAMANSIVEVNVSQKTITRVLASIPQELREEAGPSMRFGEGQVSPGGVLLLGWRSADRQSDGRVFRMDLEGEFSHSLSDVLGAFVVKVPAGLVWDEAGQLLYMVDSGEGCVYAFRCDEQGTPLGADDGDVQAKVVATIPQTKGLIKGITLDANGRLWAALGGAGQVVCIDPRSGQQVLTVQLPVNDPTSCTFGGPSMDVLYVTSMKERGAQGARASGSLFAVNVPGVVGAHAAHVLRGV